MANSKKALDENGVLYLWGKVKTYVATAIANIKLPSKTSDLTNDSGFITAKDVPEGAAASSTVPKMDGTAAAGTETAFARGDHVHPSDTTKVDKVEGKGLSANDYTNEEKAKLGGVEANANNYTLPDASASVKGGVTVGTNVDVSGGKISVKNGTTNQKGVVQLSSATDDTSTTKAATPSAVKAAYDLAAGKQSPATSLAGYGIADAYTKDEVDAKMSSALEYKGSKDTYADLPTTGNKKGDVWNIVNADAAHGVNAGDNVAWTGSKDFSRTTGISTTPLRAGCSSVMSAISLQASTMTSSRKSSKSWTLSLLFMTCFASILTALTACRWGIRHHSSLPSCSWMTLTTSSRNSSTSNTMAATWMTFSSSTRTRNTCNSASGKYGPTWIAWGWN